MAPMYYGSHHKHINCSIQIIIISYEHYIHVNPERSFRGTNGEPPSEASQLRKEGPGVLARKISKTYIANGATYVISELYL